ncbi:hypothetical protein LINGRAHAP2_LOCUS13649 [Linum grandiflorum]
MGSVTVLSLKYEATDLNVSTKLVAKMGFGEESSNNGEGHARVAVAAGGDKYRILLKEEAADPNIVWRHGAEPLW